MTDAPSLNAVDTWTVTFSPDSKQIVTGSHPGKVNFVGVESGKKEESLDTRSKFTMSIAYVSIALFLLITFGVSGIILLQVSPFVSLFPIIPPPHNFNVHAKLLWKSEGAAFALLLFLMLLDLAWPYRHTTLPVPAAAAAVIDCSRPRIWSLR